MAKPIVYDLFASKKDLNDGNPVRKFPTMTPMGMTTVFRFTAPNRAHPNGQLILAKYPPVEPSVFGMVIAPRHD